MQNIIPHSDRLKSLWVKRLGLESERPHTLSSRTTPPSSERKKIAVLGGGLAGITVAYELSKHPELDVAILEATDRLGGHVHTDYESLEGPEGFWFERGAELVDSQHHALRRLARQLGVEFVDANPKGSGEIFYRSDNKFYTNAQVQEALLPLIRQAQDDCRRAIRLHYDDRWTQRALELDQMSMRDYIQSYTRKKDPATGQPVVRPWAIKALTQTYRSELGREPDEISALAFVTAFGSGHGPDFSMRGESDESQKIRGGASNLIRTLCEAMPVNVDRRLEHYVVGVTPLDGGKGLEVEYKKDGLSGPITREHFDYVVSAMPLFQLSRMKGLDQLTSPEQQEAIRNTSYTNSIKIAFKVNGKPWLGCKELQKLGRSDGFFFTADQIFQSVWPSSYSQFKDQPENDQADSMITFLIGGRAALLPPEELIPKVRQQYAEMLGLPESEIFAENAPIHNLPRDCPVTDLGCYTSPGKGQLTRLSTLFHDHHRHPTFRLVGQFIPHITEHGVQIGYMDNAVRSAMIEAKIAVAHLLPPKLRAYDGTSFSIGG
jgi:protoporphyrinogen oxidase